MAVHDTGHARKMRAEAALGPVRGKLQLLVSPGGEGGSLNIHQDARVYSSILGAGDTVTHELAAGRHAWVQVARGRLRLNGEELGEGDGAAVSEERSLRLEGVDEAEVLVFDLA